jgi:hypothetical protein
MLNSAEKIQKIYQVYARRQEQPINIHEGSSTGLWECAEDFLLACARLEFEANEVKSIETGCGLSTLVFNEFGWNHIAITPSEQEIIGIRNWMTQFQGRTLNGSALICAPSHIELPKLATQGQKFNFVFIDGNHSLPHVLIDYFYLSIMLKTGGYLGLDDTNLAAPKLLCSIMERMPYWTLTKKGDKWAIFELNDEFRGGVQDWQEYEDWAIGSTELNV